MTPRSQLNRIAEILEGVPVWRIQPGSPAARAGVAEGDIVLSVNGHRTRTADDFLAAREPGTWPMRVVVFRGDRELELVLSADAPAARVTLAH